ncbi:MAG: 3'-5' exonuclease [Lentisphaerae bacterium]|nr:3'-5' exonuclease [Lentisphaerota bacterium]
MNWYELGPFTVFDLETTGMSPVNDRIVEIAALRVEVTGEYSEFHTLLNPGRLIPRGASRVHHITDDMVANSPRFQHIGHDFLAFARNSTLVAHNARFDLSFLQESLHRCGLPLWGGKTMDSLLLVRKLYPGLPSYSLQNLRSVLKLDRENDDLSAHRAGDDVVWTMRLLELLLSKALAAEQENS